MILAPILFFFASIYTHSSTFLWLKTADGEQIEAFSLSFSLTVSLSLARRHFFHINEKDNIPIVRQCSWNKKNNEVVGCWGLCSVLLLLFFTELLLIFCHFFDFIIIITHRATAAAAKDTRQVVCSGVWRTHRVVSLTHVKFNYTLCQSCQRWRRRAQCL